MRKFLKLLSFILLSQNQKCRLFKHFDSNPMKKHNIYLDTKSVK